MDSMIMELRLQQWKPIFEAQAKSGLGKDEWCEKNGVRRWEFYQRQRELREYMLKAESVRSENDDNCSNLIESPAFVELPMSSDEQVQEVSAEAQHNGSVEISHGKFHIKLKGNVDTSMVESIIKAVAHA